MIDAKGNEYREVQIQSENVRLTYVENGWTGSACIRVQNRDENGHLKPGPEIPLTAVGGMVGAIVELVVARHNTTP